MLKVDVSVLFLMYGSEKGSGLNIFESINLTFHKIIVDKSYH